MSFKNILKDFFGNPNVGLFCYVNNKFGLCASSLSESDIKELELIFSVKFIPVTLSGTNLIGVFCAGNDDLLFLPNIVHKSELKYLKDEFLKNNIDTKIVILNTDYTALGNNIVCTKNNCLVNPDIEDEELKIINSHFNNVSKLSISGLKNIGSMVSLNSKGLAVNPNISFEELLELKKTLGYDDSNIALSTSNRGNTFISSGILVNDFGLILGDISSSVEIQDLFQIFKGD